MTNAEIVEWIRQRLASPIEEQNVLDSVRSLRTEDMGAVLELELRGVLLELVRLDLVKWVVAYSK